MARPKKRKVPTPRSARGGGSRPEDMISRLQQIQEELAKVQEALAAETVEATAGGGAVRVVVNGRQEVQAIEIADELLDPEEKEMLQDLLIVALNQALEQSQALATERLQRISAGLSLPGLGGLL